MAENNFKLPHLGDMMSQLTVDHERADAELQIAANEKSEKEKKLRAIQREKEALHQEKALLAKEMGREVLIKEELHLRRKRLTEELLGTEMEYENSKLYELSKLKSELRKLVIRKEHSEQRNKRLDADIEKYRQSWEKYEQDLPLVHELKETKAEVAELEKQLEDFIRAHGNLDQIKQEADHLKETLAFQNLENDRTQEECVNKKKEKRILEKKKQQLTLEIRSLENRMAAKKKRLTNTIQELEAELETFKPSKTD